MLGCRPSIFAHNQLDRFHSELSMNATSRRSRGNPPCGTTITRKPGPWLRWGAPLILAATGFVAGTQFSAKVEKSEPGLPADSSPEAVASNYTFKCANGPWGNVEGIWINIELPDDAILLENYNRPVKWFFRGYSREKVIALFQSAGLSEEQLALLGRDAGWEFSADGCSVHPPDELVLSLSPESRHKIYSVLAHFRENGPYYAAFGFDPDNLEKKISYSNLPEETVSLFKKMLYPQGDLLLFNDTFLVLATLPDSQSKMRFLKTVSRRSTFLAKIRVETDSDIDELVAYWGVGGRAKDLRPLLESLSRVPGGCRLDIVHLLPSFARKRIFTYPRVATEKDALKVNCHWSSLNFFNDPPDATFLTPENVETAFANAYVPVSGSMQLGDVLLFRNPEKSIVHSAVYVADDIVFTKNGEGTFQPWLLMKLEDLTPLYSNLRGQVTVSAYRRKDM